MSKYPGIVFHYEAEITSSEDGVEKAKKHIEEVCTELGIEIFSNQGCIDYIETLNREANEIFEFKNYTEGYFENHYHFSQEISKK